MHNNWMKGSVLKDTTGENLVVAANTQKQQKCDIQFERDNLHSNMACRRNRVLKGCKVLAR